jgi:hypothetical protein
MAAVLYLYRNGAGVDRAEKKERRRAAAFARPWRTRIIGIAEAMKGR